MRRLVAVCVSVALLGCSDVSLEATPDPPEARFNDKMALSGQFCTRDPDLVLFPVKILFVIDQSQSLNITDPDCGRGDAVRAVIDSVLPTDPVVAAHSGVEIGIIGFNGATGMYTQADTDGDGVPDADGFTTDREQLAVATAEICRANSTTDYEGALSLALAVLGDDMARSSQDDLSRAKYVVVFHSDGLPNPVTPDNNTPPRIWGWVDTMMMLAEQFPVQELRLHTTYLSVNTPRAVREEATRLLQGMSERGKGTFRDFETGLSTSFVQIDFAAVRRLFALKSLIVVNDNGLPRNGKTLVDTDADGLVDEDERALGSDPLSRDTDGDGFNDLLEYRLRTSGYDALGRHDADCFFEEDRADIDGDGLLDCEERFVGTSPALFDTDADGFPDGVEYRFGTNPSGDDTLDDPDFDGAPNHVELRAHMDPRSGDAHKMADLGYRTTVKRKGFVDDRLCFEWSVENVTLVPTQLRQVEGWDGEPRRGLNDVFIYLNETAFDDPDDFGFYSVACVRARYQPEFEVKFPPTGRVRIDQGVFVDPGEFDPRRDCVEIR